MGTATPLLDRIEARRKAGRIGPVSPVPIQARMSPFARKLAERNLIPTDKTPFYVDGAWTPENRDGAA